MELPATLPNPERLSDMLDGVGSSFRSGDAYDAARAAGHDVSERTLRKDLTAAADAGILERVTAQTWSKLGTGNEANETAANETTPGAPEANSTAANGTAATLRTRLACALLSCGEWNDVYGTDGRTYSGPTPEELTDAVERYAVALEDSSECLNE
jgi:hypothetical protein